MSALPAVKAKAGAKLVTTNSLRPGGNLRLPTNNEPKEERVSLDTRSVVGLIVGGASVPLIILALARLFGHTPY
jgi:hypothetical protein